MIEELKTAGQLYKDMMPKYVSMKNKYDSVKRRRDQAEQTVEDMKPKLKRLRVELKMFVILTPTLTSYVMDAPSITFTYNVCIGSNKRRINKNHADEICNKKTQTNLNPSMQAGL